MHTLALTLTLWIAPAFLAWLFFRNEWLNRSGSKSARKAEAVAWSAFTAAAAGLTLFLTLGRSPMSTGLGDEQWLGIRLDALTLPLLTLVTFLSAVILRFSRNYLGGDPRQGEFIKGICLTSGSVIALILAPGLLQFSIAWVATSLSLHKLLVFFPDRHGTLFSARKKFLLSRVADLAVAAAFIGIFSKLGTQNFTTIFAMLEAESLSLNWIAWLIAFAALLKSAQFPFHTWLPDTMGTPTPVSALMHAGIINAGGILLIRFSPIFAEASSALYMVAAIGAVTAIFGSFVMLSQTSIKRSLAYSTIAQMGFMLMQCGLGAFHLALLHIIAHSLYKAHSFLSSGSAVNTIETLSTDAKPDRESHIPLFTAMGISFALVFGLFFLAGLNPQEKPGMLALGVVVAMATSQLLLRQLRRQINAKTILRVSGIAGGIAVAYIGLSLLAAWWLPLQAKDVAAPQIVFEALLAVVLLLALATTLQLQTGSRFLIPLRLRNALYVHALNGFYANPIANRLLKRVKLQPKSI